MYFITFKAMNPLLPFVSLSSHIVHFEGGAVYVVPLCHDAAGSYSREQNVILRGESRVNRDRISVRDKVRVRVSVRMRDRVSGRVCVRMRNRVRDRVRDRSRVRMSV